MATRKEIAQNQKILYDDAVANNMFQAAVPTFKEFQKRLEGQGYQKMVYDNYKKHNVKGKGFNNLNEFRGAFGGSFYADENKISLSSRAQAVSDSARQTVNNAGRYNRLKQRKQKQQKDFGRVNLGTHQTPYGGDANNVVKDEFAYNPETGKAGAYVTSDNDNAYTQNEAEQKQNLLDKYGEEWNNAVDMGIVPSELDKADPDLSDTDVAMRQMERRQEWLDENQNRRSKELNESMHLQGSPFVASGGAVAPSSFNTAISNEANRLSDVEYGAYNTAKAYNQMLRTTLLQELKEQKQKGENVGWWKDKWNDVSNYFGGMLDTMLDPKLFSQGVMDAAMANNMLQVKKGMEDGTIKKGSNAGNAVQAMLGAIKQQQGEAAKQQQYGTKAYQYGDMSGRSLKFMADFALSGWRNVMTTGFTKTGEKVGEKMALGALGKWFTKNTGRVLGDIAGSAALAATNQLGSTYNNVIERYVGMNNENGGVTQDKNGDLKFNEGVSLGRAIKDGFGSATIENFSEMFGEYLPGASKLLSKLGLSKVSSFFEKIGNNAYYKWLSNATNKSGIQGVMAEISEEEFGTALHAAWGDGDGSWSDFNVFTNPDAREKQIDTCLGMFYSVGFMQAPRTAVGAINAVRYFNIKHQVTKADKFGQMMFNDKWEEIKDKIDVTTNADLTKTVLEATRSDSMTAKQKGAVINYAMFLSKLRGFNQASDAKTKDKVEEGETAPTLSNDLDDVYTEGHNADDADKHNIQLEQNDKANELAAMLHITPGQLHDMADEDLEAMTGQNDKLDQAIYDYQVSTAKYQGVMDGAQDEVDMAAHQAAMETDNMTDLSRGTVRKATFKATGGLEDYEVYIISGNIATYDDGSIDVGNSDDMIIYYDPTTGRKEHADAMMFADLIEELPAADVKAQAINDAKENAIKKIAGIIDGTVEVGSQFSVTDADGTEHTYEVLADNGNGTAMITIDGNVPTELVKGENVQIPYTFAYLQQMKDMEDQKRLEAAKAEREQMEKERAEQQKQAQTTQAENPALENNTQSAHVEDNLDYSDIIREDGKVQMVDVSDKDGNNLFPDAKDVFYIQGNKIRTKFAYIDANGELKTQSFPTGLVKIKTRGEVSVDDYKKYRATILSAESSAMPESSMIEDNSGENRGEIEVETPTIEGETTAPAEETAAPESAETPATEQTPAAPAMTLEDGTIVPMLEDGNPDFSKLTAEQTAELYDSQFGEDADGIVSGYVSDAKKALDKANNMTVKGKTFVEQKASKDAKEKAIADAQAAYDSAVAIRDAYNERQLAKVEDTAEGRKNLIEKARRKFARLKSAVKDDAEAVAQIYKETVGSLLHRLYDGTGIDVTDTNPLTAEEYVASNLSAHSLNYEGTETSKGVKQETGLSREDFAKTQLLAADGKGTTIDNLVHSLWENRPSNLDSLNTQDIRNALIGVLTSGFKASEARSYVENIRIAQAEKLIEEERTAAENAIYYEQQKAKEEEEKKKAELEKKAEEEKKNADENIDLPAIDKQGEPINNNIIELAKWAKEQGLEIDSTSKLNSYADLFLMCKDGFGVSTLVPDEGKNINQVIYFPDNAEVVDQLGKLQEEFNAGRDLNHSSNIDSEITEGATFYDAATAKEFRDFVNEQIKFPDKLKEGSKAIETPGDATDEKPLGEQLNESDLPFSAKENGKQQTTSERAADVEKNKVDDMKVVDNIVGQKTRKAFERLAKMMGANIQWQYSDKLGNGWIQETKDADGNVHRTIFITLDSSITEGAQFIFGHEMTHQIKNLNPAAYNELTQLVLDTYGSDAFDKAVDETMKRYSDAGFSGRAREYYAEEVVADAVGEMIRDLNLAHTLAMKMSHPLLAAIHEILQKIKLAFFGTEYSDVTKNIIRSIEQAYVKTANGEVTNSKTGEDVSFSLRQKPEPKKKGIGYKVFVLKDGKLYPPMVANPDGAATPVGVWLDADAAPIAGESKTGRPQVKQGGKGTQGGSGKLAYRPGWHLGVVPYAIQFNRKDADGNKTLFPKNFVFAEVEYAADVDYQEEARQEGINPSGKYQHSLAGLKHLPTDGYYMYRTNPNPETDPWVITGAMKVNRILTRAEQADLVSKAGREPQQIQEGDIVTDDVVNSINQEIADAPKFSIKTYHGSQASFDKFDHSFMGSGEGAQAYGWGTYVTEVEGIAKAYAKQNSAKRNTKYSSAKFEYDTAKSSYNFAKGTYDFRMQDIDKLNNTLKWAKEQLVKAKESNRKNWIDEFEARVADTERALKENQDKLQDEKAEMGKAKKEMDEAKKRLDAIPEPERNLYTVEIPDDNGDNYLDWDGKAPDGLKEKVLDRLYNERREDFVDKMRKAGFNDDQIKEEADYTVNKEEMADTYLKHSATGGGLYRDLSYYLGEQKKASLFLKDMGIDGVKVIAKRNTGGNKEGKMNYVIFDENNAQITNHTKFSLRLKSAIDETETNPSDAQKESGNYKKGHIKFGGYDYTIENPKGSTRSGKDADGKEWKVTMHDTYGYIRGKFGKDGDHLDMFINDKADLDNWNGDVFVVDQVNPDGSFDEHKVMYGYDSMDDAKKAYLANYSDGWKGLGNITGASKDEFDKWLDTSNRKLKPFADYAKVKFSFKDIKPVGVGAFGNIYNQFRGNAKAAIEFLKKVRGGEAVGALHHKDIGDIDLVWGKEGTGHSDGYGLSKLVKYHPEVLDNLQEILNDMRVVSSSKNRVNLESETHKAGVRLTWDGERKSWLLTAFKKETSASDKRTDTAATSLEGDTALSQTEGSAAKIDNSSETAKENGEKFSLKDDEYLKAVENGDMEKAQKMVNEAAEAAGYSTDSSYQGTSAFNGSAPWGNGYFLTKEERKEAWDNDEYDGDQTLGDYIHRGIDAMNLDFIALDPRNYRAADPMRKEAIDNVRNAIRKKSETITMYRSVPSDVKEGSFRNGDWVTPSRAYAVENAKVHGWGDNFNIIEQKVPVDEIWWDGNDIAEWGYGREEDYVNDTDFAYKNTKNNRKLLDAVTYDDNGNVIPLSQRFNENNADVRYSLKDEKTMFGMHNISLDKLRKAIKQGGFAAPSMGVIDSKNGIYSGYGEITLIPKAEKIAKRTGKNIGTYAADAWTPIYPPVEKKFGGNGGDVAYKDIESVPKEMQGITRNAINGFMDGRDANSLAYLYLHEKGKAPELVHVEGKYPKELHDEVKGILGKLNGIYNTTDEQKEKLLDLFIREVYDGNKEEFDNDIKKFIKKDEEFIKKRPNSNISKDKQLDVDWMKEHGYDYGALSRFVDGILRDAETSGKVDTNATIRAAQQYISKNGLKNDFYLWKEKLNDRYQVEEVIFAGYKADGNRKYLPNTVENAVKVMKQDGKNASVGSASFSHFVASILKPMGTLDQIRKKKGNLTGNYEDVEKFREKWQPVYDELADKMQPGAGAFESYGMDRLEEAAAQKNPKEYAKDEYGVDLTDEDIDKLNELIDAVKNEKPSIYFETKFMRPYGLDEFEKAIVPNDTPSDVVDALKMAGIDVSSYERGNAEDRQKVTMDAINSSDNIRFSLKSMMEKPEGWKQANKKTIHIAEAIERDPKFSLKNLDGTLIKAGTYFSGGGLVEEGLKGIIDPVVAVEYDEKISGVYRNNFGQHIVTADVRDVDPKELVKQIDGEVEYFHASPVCKNYSQAKSNHAEVELDKETAASTAEFINAIKPKVVTIENVKGYKDSDAMKIITDALDANGYTWDADVYNAADYGGYTNRERLIVRAVREGKLPEKPKKMARKSGWYEAVADIIPTLTEKKNGVAPWMDIRLKADGIDWRNIDKPLYVMGSAYADGKVPHAFADELLPTLRTKSGDVIVMPGGKVYRAMGRVLARVSGVSDDYKMPFSENLSHTIIGNGIPTQLTEHVIAPLLQNTLRPTTPEDGNIKFSLRGSTPYDKQMEEWMEKNHLEKGAVPMEKPVMKEGENIFDYANRMVEWTRNQNLWKTAPKQTGFQDALDKWKSDNGLSPDAYPPVRPHRENYSTEIGYTEDLEEYNKKKELWKSAPKPKDFDLSVDLEDMNKQLRNIRRAVLNQKNYDQRTIKAVSDLVRKMLNIGWGDGLSRGKVGNLLSAAKNATGANDVKKYLDKAMGILAENYLNRLSTAYDNLINTKGARADQSGVIKMGSLDANGQAFMSEYKKAINMDDKSLNNYIANIEEDSAKNEDNVEMNDYRLAGIQAAIMYKQQIGGNDADIAELKRQIGELKNKKDVTKEDKDLLNSLEKKLFENKFDRITMFENLLNNIQRMVKESKGRAKEFREKIAEHKNEILHRANLDLEGVDSTYYDTTTAKKKFVNNDLQRAVFSSTYTFEQFLKFFGKHSANGEGRLYNYFHKLNQDALDEEQLYNEMNRNALDEKTKELFGKNKFMNLVGIDGKGMKEMDVEVTDYSNKETGKRTIHLKQGQMLYIYLVNKETDGEMKLRAMGITEEDVAAIEENLDPRVKAMGEWLQDEYLPECQRRYQATHTKYFGAPMKEVENYFPLAINNRARNVKEDVNQDSDAMSQLAGTSTGAIVTRRVNVIPLDIENADAFEVAFNHLQEMEEWSAMLPFRQDINTLLSYTHFRNQVQNMSSVAYGSGKTLWDEFKQTAQIAAGTYKPKVNAGMMDSRIAATMGGIAVAKISGRLWTAIKQSQSATVFLPECDFTRFVKNGVNPYGSWKWAMENIPDFRKRVENMTYGDVKLRQYLDELEKWHDWTKTISKIGMAPNILVDGITCAVGARSVYETEVNRLTKLGYPKEKAEEKAYYKAVAAYNKTQQSSGGMYLSPMQVDRTYVSAALSLFKNANFAYGRMQIEACRGLARTYDFWGGKHNTTLIESMTRQIMEEDGLDENTARAIAKATYNRTFRQSIGRLINFATLVPVSWALYKVLPYLLTGDDDDKKKDMIEEAVLKGFATSLSDNYVIPFVSNILNAGLKVEDGKPTFDPEVFRYQNLYINPATSDLANIYSMVGNQKWYSVANKLGMLGVQSLIGFNPETVGALYQALSEADYDNGNTAKEWQIGILKAISAPEESIRELYMDELGLKGGNIKKIPLAELEKRYAERQINRDNLLSQIGMDAETFNGYVDKYQKSFEKKIKDKMDKWNEYDKKKADEFFDTTSDPKLRDMIEKKRTKDANAAANEQIAKEGLNQEKKGKEPSEEAYNAVKMSIDVAEDNAISTYNKVLNKRYAALNDEYNEQTDAMKYIFMSKHPNFKAYKELESEYTNYGKKIKELKEKLVSADGYDAKQTILKQIRAEREKFSELQSKVR